MKLADNLDGNLNELQNVKLHTLSTAPSGALGRFYFDSTKNQFGYYNGTSFVYMGDNSTNLNGQAASYYLTRSNHTGTQTSSTISDFTEAAQDAVGGVMTDTNSIDFTYDDTNNLIKADVKPNATAGIEVTTSGVGLKTSGVSAGTYTKVTVDTYGRVTSASAQTAGDIPSHSHTASNVSDFSTAVAAIRLDQHAAPTASVGMNNQKIINLADPVSPQDAATKNYVDNAVAGLDQKSAVLVATTANITLSGTQTIDGVAVVAGDRVLVKNQSTASANGIYIVSASGWTRAADTAVWNELINAYCWVSKGTTQADTGWVCTVDAGGTLGTTSVTWVQYNAGQAYLAGSGLTLSGNQFSAVVDNVTLQVNGSNQLESKGVYRLKKYSTTIGNGTLTSCPVTHNMGTRDVIVSVMDSSTYEIVYPTVTLTDANTVTIKFSTAPAANAYTVVVIGGGL